MKLPLRQDKSRKGGRECDLKPFVAIQRVQLPRRSTVLALLHSNWAGLLTWAGGVPAALLDAVNTNGVNRVFASLPELVVPDRHVILVDFDHEHLGTAAVQSDLAATAARGERACSLLTMDVAGSPSSP
jgi:hypothetical protein